MRSILIVRLGALGDILHTIPVAAALRTRFPNARIDWVVDERHRAILDLVPVVNRRLVFRTLSASLPARIVEIRRNLVSERYDIAVDVQGLLKSAVVAKFSGASRVIGFTTPHLRESAAGIFYTDRQDPAAALHVIRKNLTLAGALGADVSVIRFPLRIPSSPVADVIRARVAHHRGFAVLNPGAAWASKRWLPERFGAVAQWLRRVCDLASVVTWGPGDEMAAAAVVASAAGSAELAPPTGVADLAAVIREASLTVSGDTGPAHLAAAVGTPLVGLFGPTDPVRNGPWSKDDLTVSRFAECRCHHRRRCSAAQWCLEDISVNDVTETITQRLEERTP